MTDAHVLRTTLEALDGFVESLRSRSPRATAITQVSDGEPRFVIDEGRAAAEWTLDIDRGDGVERVGLLVVCEIDHDRLSDARLYVALPHSSKEAHP